MAGPFRRSGPWAIPLAFAALKLLLHAAAVTHYGYFRDELYYIACSRHLAWGYVDQPPLSILLLAAQRLLLGNSLPSLRLLPALSGAATVLLTGLLAREFGGGRLAQALACLCVLLSPVYLAVDHFFSMNAFDTFFWTLAAFLLARALRKGRTGVWLAFGAVLGLGLLNKSSMIWFGGGAVFGLLLSGRYRLFAGRGIWLAALLAIALFLPHVLWQIRHGWPTLEFMRNATGEKMVHTSPVSFWMQQLLVLGPSSVSVWLVGLGWLLARRDRRPFGILFLAVALLLMASGTSRPNYLAVAYPALFAAGGVAWERVTDLRHRWLRPVVLAEVALLGIPIVPLGLPILPVETEIAYTHRLGIGIRAQEHAREGPLPQIFADMFGWEELTRKVAAVYHDLPEADRARCAIFASNYGEAGAIDFFGPRYGLPPAISAHNSYWFWGPRGATGEVIIYVGGRRNDPHADFRSVELADTTSDPYCMPFENGAPILVCRGLGRPLGEVWKGIRRFE